MASFTDEEYADAARIEAGYDQFFKVLVPYSFDRGFGALNHLIMFSDKANGIEDRPLPFSVIDGMDEAKSGTIPGSYFPVQHFEAITGSKFTPVTFSNVDDLISTLVDQSSMKSNGASVIFVKSPDSPNVSFALSYKEGTLSLIREEVILGERTWKPRDFEIVVVDGKTTFQNEKEGRNFLSSLKHSDFDEPLTMDVIVDPDRLDLEVSHPSVDSVRQTTKDSRHVATMCLMMTESWLRPIPAKVNNPTVELQEHPVDLEHMEESNCTEVSTAVGLNFSGGINGTLVEPKARLLPGPQALQDGSVLSTLAILDPLHNQSIANRVFGNEASPSGYGAPISSASIGKQGAVVSVFGHTFFAREDDGIDVYDLAMKFAGKLPDYETFLELVNITTALRRVTEVRPYDQSLTDFHRKCREPFLEPQAQVKANDIFVTLPKEAQTLDNLYECWNRAVVDNPARISAALGIEHFQEVASSADSFQTRKSIVEMLESQENGFVCLKETHLPSGNAKTIIVFKDGDKLFVAAGRISQDSTTDLENTVRNSSTSGYTVTAFGGNDLNRMREIQSQGIETPQLGKAGDVVSR